MNTKKTTIEKIRPRLKPDESYGFTDIEGAMRITGLSASAIYKMTARLELPFYKPAGKLLFKISELVNWIELSKVS